MEETKMKVTVSAFDPNTKCPYVSVSDESFALLLLENYLADWSSGSISASVIRTTSNIRDSLEGTLLLMQAMSSLEDGQTKV